MYTIRRGNSRMQRMRKSSSSRWCRGGSLRSAREGRSALFIMIKLKREILIKVLHSDLPLLFKLSLTPRASLVSVTRVQTMEDLWCTKVIITLISVVLRVLWTIFRSLITINYLLVSLQHLVKMEVVVAEMQLSIKWWCKEIFRCCNNSSKYCFPHSFQLNCRISIFKTTALLISFLLITKLVTNNLLSFSQAPLFRGHSQWINKFITISSIQLLIETAGVPPPPTLLSIFSSINLSK